MHNCYRDILDRIAEPVSWFDDRAVPRYSRFTPGQLGNIHADEAALAEISCQSCGRIFRVALTGAFADRGFSLSDAIRLRRASYYDPPNVECCGAGPSMTSVMHAVLEYWSRNFEIDFDWHRDPSLEGPCEEEWLDPPDTVADVNAALDAGATKILVLCTSRQNRHDLVGRITAALMATVFGRVNVLYPDDWTSTLAKAMFRGHVPDVDVGVARDGLKVSLSDFVQARGAEFGRIDGFILVSGPSPKRAILNSHPETMARQKAWSDTARRMVSELDASIRIELALAHSRPMLDYPDAVIDAGRSVRSEG